MAPDAYMIRDQKAMPAPLQGVIFQARRKDLAWCCWKDSSGLWLLTCEMLLDLSREHGSPVLDVQLYGENGELKDNGTWGIDAEGKWRRGGGPNGHAYVHGGSASP